MPRGDRHAVADPESQRHAPHLHGELPCESNDARHRISSRLQPTLLSSLVENEVIPAKAPLGHLNKRDEPRSDNWLTNPLTFSSLDSAARRKAERGQGVAEAGMFRRERSWVIGVLVM